jgi:predicted lipid-binding transport protein (Tim44 family)
MRRRLTKCRDKVEVLYKKEHFMASDTLVYHPPKKEPSFFNPSFWSSMMVGVILANSLGGALIGGAIMSTIGGAMGYIAEDKSQRNGIKAEKDKSIFNWSMLVGGLIFGLTALALPEVGAGLATIIGITGGIGMGAMRKEMNNRIYSLAETQQNERIMGHELAVSQAKIQSLENELGKTQEKPIYKNIPDLPAIPEHEHGNQQAKFAETERTREDNNTAAAYASMHSMGSM